MDSAKLTSKTIGHLQKQQVTLLQICALFGDLSKQVVTDECKNIFIKIMHNFGCIIYENKSLLQCLEAYASCGILCNFNQGQQRSLLPATGTSNNHSKSDMLGAVQQALSSDKNVTLTVQSQSEECSTSLMLLTDHFLYGQQRYPPQPDAFKQSFQCSSAFRPAVPPAKTLPDRPSVAAHDIEFGDVSSEQCHRLEQELNDSDQRPQLSHSVSDNILQQQPSIEELRQRRNTDSDIPLPTKNNAAHNNKFKQPQNGVDTQCVRNIFRKFINTSLPSANMWFTFERFGLKLSDQDISHIKEENKDNAFARKFSMLEKWAEGKTFSSKEDVEQQLEEARRQCV